MLGQVAPLVDESWRIKFERVKEDGFIRLRGFWVMREIVAPILMKLLTALCVPYVFSRGLFPVFGYSLLVNSAVYRFAWSGCLVLGMLWYGIRCLQQWISELHNSIRDDRYLIGKRLHNFGEKTVEAEPVLLIQAGAEESANPSEQSLDSPLLLNSTNSIGEGFQHEILDNSSPPADSMEDFNDNSQSLGLRRRHSSLGTSGSSME